jgi:signal transduction histidine kinase
VSPARRLVLAVAGVSSLAMALVYAGLFTLLGATPGQAARGAVAVVAPSAAVAVWTVRLPRRWPWPGGAPLRALGLAIALSFLATAGWVLLGAVDSWATGGAVRTPPRAVLVWQAVVNGLTQLVVLGAAYAGHNGHRAQRAEALRARAELHLLRSQLNPHFILNTLHALLGLVRRDPALAELAVERLGELLRFGMSVEQRATDRVTVREEWAFVVGYLELERVRLGERLRVTLQADDTAMDVDIPPFAIQPLVENSITHAVAPRAAGGRLDVSVKRNGGRVRVEVQDDGPGADPDAILQSPRLGMRLLRDRLATLYAGEAHLTFAPVPAGGLRAVLDLPDGGLP